MRTGKLSISRGHQLEGGKPQAPAPVAANAAPADYQLVNERLSALERLSRLLEQGVLSAEEFAAEKAAVLRLPAAELVLGPECAVAPQRVARGPSLAGRLFSWKFLPAGVAAGLALSFFAQPRETMAALDQAMRLIGA